VQKGTTVKIKKAKTKLVENKIIKPPLKICSNKPTFVKWIVSHFPDNYQDLIYVDPYCGGLNILALKEKSFIEVVNDLDNSLVEIYKSLRSEPKEFVKRLGRHGFCEETFNKAQKKIHIKSDYLDDSINEYIVRKMSKMELKRSFCKTNLSSWNDSLKCLFNFASRIQETFIFNNKAIEIIKTFNFENTLLYCDPPHLHETKKGKTVSFQIS
jgi:DNA adenine methylase